MKVLALALLAITLVIFVARRQYKYRSVPLLERAEIVQIKTAKREARLDAVGEKVSGFSRWLRSTLAVLWIRVCLGANAVDTGFWYQIAHGVRGSYWIASTKPLPNSWRVSKVFAVTDKVTGHVAAYIAHTSLLTYYRVLTLCESCDKFQEAGRFDIDPTSSRFKLFLAGDLYKPVRQCSPCTERERQKLLVDEQLNAMRAKRA